MVDASKSPKQVNNNPTRIITIPGASIDKPKVFLGICLIPLALTSGETTEGNARETTETNGGTSKSTKGSMVTNQKIVSPPERTVKVPVEEEMNDEDCA